MVGFKVGAGLLLACVAVSSLPSHAHACSCWGLDFIWSSPENGDKDVPLDIVPALRGGFDELEFQRADGTPVDFARTDAQDAPLSCVLNSELIPEQRLAPNTTYVIRARKARSSEPPIELRFTTGAAASEERELFPPPLTLSMIRTEYAPTCGDTVRGCVRTIEGEQVELTFLSGDKQVARRIVADKDEFPPLASEPDCIEARVRDVAGRRSAPTRMCGTELVFRTVAHDPYYYASCEEGVIVPRTEPGGAPVDAETDAGTSTGSEATGDSPATDAGTSGQPRRNDDTKLRAGDGCSASGTRTGDRAFVDITWLTGLALLTIVCRRSRRA